MLTAALPIMSMVRATDISIRSTSAVMQANIENHVESLTTNKHPNGSGNANLSEHLTHKEKRLVISFGPCQPLGPSCFVLNRRLVQGPTTKFLHKGPQDLAIRH